MKFIKAKNLTPIKVLSLTEIATLFRQKHEKYLGFTYKQSITSKISTKRNKNGNIANAFMSDIQKYSIDVEDYLNWYFTEKIKSRKLKFVQFYFAISKYMISDYLLYLKQTKKIKSFDKLEQGASLSNHESAQEDYFTLNQIPRNIAESKKRHSLGSFTYAATLKKIDKIVIKGQVRNLQNLSSQDLAYIKKLAKSKANSFLSKIYVELF